MTGYSEPEPDSEPATDRLPLPVPEFSLGNMVIRVIAAILCFLLMGWVATR
jgi:hypothetical protein